MISAILSHLSFLHQIEKKGLRGPFFDDSRAPLSVRRASSSTSTNSSRDAATTSSTACDAALEDRVGDAARVQADRPARIVVARDHVVDPPGEWLVSTTPITGMPSLLASATAPFW